MAWQCLIGSGARKTQNRIENGWKRINAWFLQKIFKNTSVFFMFLAGNPSKIESPWKSTKRVWLGPVFDRDYEYTFDFVQKLTYEANRAKENIAHKLQSKISQSNHNEITIHKFQVTLWWMLYQIPMLIALINGFEIQPLEAHSVDSARFWSRFVQTDQGCWLRRRIVMFFQLKDARIIKNHQLPLMFKSLQQLDLAMISLRSSPTEVQYHLQVMNQQRNRTKIDKILMKWSKKCCENWSKMREFESFCFWICELWLVSAVSVRD